MDSPLRRLRNALQDVAQTATVHATYLTGNEAATRAALIEPTLRALGWEIAEPAMVRPLAVPGASFVYQLCDETGTTRVLVGTWHAGFVFSPDADAGFTRFAESAPSFFATNGIEWQQFLRTASGELMPGPVVKLSGDAQTLTQTASYLVRQLDAAHFWTGGTSNAKPADVPVSMVQPVAPVVPRLAPDPPRLASAPPAAILPAPTTRAENEDTEVEGPVTPPVPVESPSVTSPAPSVSPTKTKSEPEPTPVSQKESAPPRSAPVVTPLSALAQKPVRGKTPRLLLLPDGTTTAVYRWSALLTACAEFVLQKKPSLVLPVTDAKGKGNLLTEAALPVVNVPVTVGNRTVYVRADYEADDCLANAIYLLGLVEPFAGQVEPGARLS